MILVFFLKTLCDLSYIMCFEALIGSSFGVSPNLFPYVLLFSICSAIAMVLDGKGRPSIIRFIPVAAGAACIVFAGNTPSAIALILPAVYMIYICLKRLFHVEYYNTVDSFTKLSALLGVMAFIVLLFGGWKAFGTYSGPFVIVYLLGMILLMRMQRHSEETMKQPAFLIMNGASIAGVCILAISLFSNAMITIIKTVFLIVYNVTIVPFVYIISPLVAGIGWLIAKFFYFIMTHNPFKPQNPDMAAEEAAKEQLENHLSKGLPKELIYVLYAVFIAALLTFIFRKLVNKRRQKIDGDNSVSISSYTYTGPVEKPLSFSSIFPTTPTGQIRFYYRKLLLFFMKQGLPITVQMDTSEIEERCCRIRPEQTGLIKKMRLLYMPARYGSSIQKRSAEEAKKIYRAIKKASR